MTEAECARALREIMGCEIAAVLEALVASWHSRPGYERHHRELGCKPETTCGAVYRFCDLMFKARAALAASPPPSGDYERGYKRGLEDAAKVAETRMFSAGVSPWDAMVVIARDIRGLMQSGEECPNCRGTGRIDMLACYTCGASGRINWRKPATPPASPAAPAPSGDDGTPAEKLRRWCLDYDGSWMDRRTTPHDGIHCDDLYDAAHELDRLTRERDEAKAECARLLADREHLTQRIRDTEDLARAECARLRESLEEVAVRLEQALPYLEVETLRSRGASQAKTGDLFIKAGAAVTQARAALMPVSRP